MRARGLLPLLLGYALASCASPAPAPPSSSLPTHHVFLVHELAGSAPD